MTCGDDSLVILWKVSVYLTFIHECCITGCIFGNVSSFDIGWREGEGEEGFRNPGVFERRHSVNFVDVMCGQIVYVHVCRLYI